ncbi:MAG: carbohydrate-binding domain-containing protein [Clostridia bacterium]|nr:carbohydrate-binding domain-containing protein [Clostridia bacterium]
MKKILIALTLVLSLAVSAMGCSLAESAISLDVNDYFSKRDLAGEWKESKATAITLSESVTISTEGTYILSGTLADGTITVNAGKDDKVQLVLNGVNVTSSNSAALLVENAGKVFVTLADGTENFLTSTGFDESSDIDAAVYAKDDIVFNGTGSLTVTSAKHGILGKDDVKFASGTYIITTQGRGIDAKDGIAIADGSFTIVSQKDAIRSKNKDEAEKGYVMILGGVLDLTVGGGSANGAVHTDDMFTGGRGGWSAAIANTDTDSMKGIKSTGALTIAGGSLTIDAADDAVHSDTDVTVYGGSLTISTGDDAMHADSNLTINGGDIAILKSYEGLEAAAITINDGSVSLVSSDDGINSSGGSDASGFGWNDMFANDGSSIIINGGYVHVNASGDGIDSNGDLIMNGGTLVVSGPTNAANGALDANGSLTVNGGTVIAAGAVGMAETFGSASTQVSFLTNLSGAAGSEIVVKDENGNVILSGTVEKNFSCVVISSLDLKVGETYTVSAGSGDVSVTVNAISNGSGGGFGGVPGGGNGGGFGGGPHGGNGGGFGGRGGEQRDKQRDSQRNGQLPQATPDMQNGMPAPDASSSATPNQDGFPGGQNDGFDGSFGGSGTI